MRHVLLVCGLFIGLSSACVAQSRRATQPDRKVAPAAQPQKTLFTIRAKDEKTGAELPATYSVEAVLARKNYEGKSKAGTPYKFTLERSDTLVVISTAPGYETVEEVMVITCDTCGFYEHTAVLAKDPGYFTNIEANQVIRLDNVYFDQSSYVLRPESSVQLDKLVNTLQRNPKMKIEISGHTDNVGDRRLNQALSENRAKIIANYLTSKGIPEKRLTYRGYGGSRPVAPNNEEDSKKKNRRVEFLVLEN